jgi:hypothetical protein
MIGGISLAENIIGTHPNHLPQRGLLMKKNEFSELGSNMLIVGSVTLAFAPFVLGDRLFMIVTGLIQQGGMMIDQVGNYFSWLVS